MKPGGIEEGYHKTSQFTGSEHEKTNVNKGP